MNQPTRKEVQAFIDALHCGMKVSHAPAFLIALAEGFLKYEAAESRKQEALKGSVLRRECNHLYETAGTGLGCIMRKCAKCGKVKTEIFQ